MKTLKLTENEITIIVTALAERPYKEVMNLIPKIVQQMKESEEEVKMDEES